jgi:hypothetical protein
VLLQHVFDFSQCVLISLQCLDLSQFVLVWLQRPGLVPVCLGIAAACLGLVPGCLGIVGVLDFSQCVLVLLVSWTCPSVFWCCPSISWSLL